MIYIPNHGSRVPLILDYEGNAQISNAVNMSGYFTAPLRGRDESEAGGYVSFVQPIGKVPQLAVDLAMVKTWNLDISVTSGPVTISVSEDLEIPGPMTLMERITTYKNASFSRGFTNSNENLTLLVNVGTFTYPPTYIGNLGAWRLPIIVSVSLFDSNEDTASRSGIGSSIFNPDNGANSAVNLTIGSQPVDIYYSVSEMPPPSGSISITPVAWFS